MPESVQGTQKVKVNRDSEPQKANWSARFAFESGEHRDVVERVRAASASPDEAMALVASLGFLGRIEEAKSVWEFRHTDFGGAERARARFAIAAALTRISRFKEARRWLKSNLNDNEAIKFADPQQGVALYYYYLGQFDKASSRARKALGLALKTNDSYMRILATDLYGHALVQTGRRSAGLRHLEQARTLAARRSHADSFNASRLIYESEMGLRPHVIVHEIEHLLSSTASENSYTRANLVLELARQLTLRGQFKRARELLDRESHFIYSFENRRQEATLQLRLAEISYRQGDAANATHFLKAARRCLNRIADRVFEIRILGLEHKVNQRLLKSELSAESTARLIELSEKHPSPMNSKILSRNQITKAPLDPRVEDPLGDLLDRANQNQESAVRELLENGYLGLWPETQGFVPGFETLALFPSGQWIAMTRDEVIKSQTPLSALSIKILLRLSTSLAGKEALMKDVWRLNYDPLRHDSVIYAALATLRKTLGPAARWIETLDEGWALSAPLTRVQGVRANVSAVSNEKMSEVATESLRQTAPNDRGEDLASSDYNDSLNFRQQKALYELKLTKASSSREMWTVPDYKKFFHVSTMTAWRDLDGLTDSGYLKRIGRGRATVYVKNVAPRNTEPEVS